MSKTFYTADELAQELGRDRREIEKLASRGQIPGRRVADEWRFNRVEITQWLEQEIRNFGADDLAQLEQSQQSVELNNQIPIADLLTLETVQVPLDAGTKPSVLRALVEVAGRTWQVFEPAAVLDAVIQRENVMSTGFDHGVAIPHPRNPLPEALGESVIAFGRTLSGIPFGAPKRQLTDMFFLVLARDSRTHLQILTRLARLLQLPDFVPALRAAETSPDALAVIHEADQRVGG
ncbi:MAG: PTS sugar transporter subunit IIA [Planctomycetaceae bacterium]